jgi:hypothetical protein
VLTLFYNGLEETTENVDAIASTDTGEAGMIGQGLVQIITNEPADAEPISCMTHQQTFGAYPFKEHDQLQFEEDNGINRGTTSTGVGLLHELADKGEIKCSLQVPIEMIGWNQVFQ